MSNEYENLEFKNVPMGTFHVSKTPIEFRTVLGSCISVCVRDPIVKVGGMNHFLLPDSKENSMSAQYGTFSMELLINGVLESGGLKNRLEVKVFGGANVIKSSQKIGVRNQEFVLDYLRDEKLNVSTKDIGGNQARKLKYYPHTGKAFVQRIEENKKIVVSKQENKFSKDPNKSEYKEDLEFF